MLATSCMAPEPAHRPRMQDAAALIEQLLQAVRGGALQWGAAESEAAALSALAAGGG